MSFRNAKVLFASILVFGFLGTQLLTETARAQVYFEGSFAPVLTESNNSIRATGGSFEGEGEVSTARTMGYGFRTTLGYTFWQSFLVGLSVDVMSSTTKRSATATGDTEKDAKFSQLEYGPTLGYVQGGFPFTFTYLLASEAKHLNKESDSTGTVTVDSETTNKGGSGFLVNVGYAFNLNSYLSLGPSLIYRKVTYSSQSYTDKLMAANSYGDKSFFTKATQTEWTPFLSLIARF